MCLAPMVRVGTLPMRALARQMGADLVYSEEIVDKKMVQCSRRLNPALGTVDFASEKGLCLRVLPEEPLVFQVGTANAAIALQAAQLVEGDVRAVDVNMGCPKHFSVSGGMGAALLRTPEVAEDILKTLKRNLSVPVSCKIRLLDDMGDTLELARRLERCGVDALAVHARLVADRSSVECLLDCVRDVVGAVGVPVVHNGDVFLYEDIARARARTGAQAVMIARGAQWNASVFRKEGALPLIQVIREYLQLARRYDNHPKNTKFVLLKMIELHKVSRELYDAINRAQDLEAISAAVETLGVAEEALTGPYSVPLQLKPRTQAKRHSSPSPSEESADKKVR